MEELFEAVEEAVEEYYKEYRPIVEKQKALQVIVLITWLITSLYMYALEAKGQRG
jgi:hypothetical protein